MAHAALLKVKWQGNSYEALITKHWSNNKLCEKLSARKCIMSRAVIAHVNGLVLAWVGSMLARACQKFSALVPLDIDINDD